MQNLRLYNFRIYKYFLSKLVDKECVRKMWDIVEFTFLISTLYKPLRLNYAYNALSSLQGVFGKYSLCKLE